MDEVLTDPIRIIKIDELLEKKSGQHERETRGCIGNGYWSDAQCL